MVESPIPQIIDTYPAFIEYWQRAESLELEAQVTLWVSEYMALWPDLWQKQVEDYSAQGIDWRQIAADRIFPHLAERLPLMAQAHDELITSLPNEGISVCAQLGLTCPLTFVVYVGIGCGAGWATTYKGTAAVLFGLENIAELGWTGREALQGLLAHELGHVVFSVWRSEEGIVDGSGPWWQLYEEGFAQRCEVLLRGSWHEVQGPESQAWLERCRKIETSLAREFLRRATVRESVKDFFGSWFEVNGVTQAGYYLGHEALRVLGASMDLRDTALLRDVESAIRPILEQMAA